ncbi:MAG: hypothetical protein ACYDEY_14160, partial [Acidimicrobiales bacterium]
LATNQRALAVPPVGLGAQNNATKLLATNQRALAVAPVGLGAQNNATKLLATNQRALVVAPVGLGAQNNATKLLATNQRALVAASARDGAASQSTEHGFSWREMRRIAKPWRRLRPARQAREDNEPRMASSIPRALARRLSSSVKIRSWACVRRSKA